MADILNKIAEFKHQELLETKAKLPLNLLRQQPKPELRNFAGALQNKRTNIIAEIKKASPSLGVIRKDFDVEAIAKTYDQHGASCISVLTEQHFFLGDPAYIQRVKAVTHCPILRKDFIVDAYQVEESRMLGADCILLIVALLDDYQLNDYCSMALELGMDVLVESHHQSELERALTLPTLLMGINNRCLKTFSITLETSIQLAADIPNDKIIIAESGIHSAADIKQLREHHINAFLIGECLMREADIGAGLDKLLI